VRHAHSTTVLGIADGNFVMLPFVHNQHPEYRDILTAFRGTNGIQNGTYGAAGVFLMPVPERGVIIRRPIIAVIALKRV
jgi:hypothetical protein